MSYADIEYTTEGGRLRRASPRPTPSSARAFYERQAQRALEKLAALDRFGEDEFEDGTIIAWEYQFHTGTKVYSYAAIKCGGLWYSTGPNAPKAYSWSQMVDWWSAATNDIEIWYAPELARHV
jgi:hypothetical protein